MILQSHKSNNVSPSSTDLLVLSVLQWSSPYSVRDREYVQNNKTFWDSKTPSSKTLPFTLSGRDALCGWTSTCALKKQSRMGWHSVSEKLLSASFFPLFFLVFFCPVLSFTPTPGFSLLFPSYTILPSPCNFLLLCFQSFRIIYYCEEVKTTESLTVWKLY